jgi:hypothetical protein
VGSYSVTPNGLTSSNYAISFADGTVDVGQKALTVTADADPSSASVDHFLKVYGSANPTFMVRYSGFVLGQDASVLGGTLGFATAASASSPVGSYSVTPNGLTSSNYAISFADGTVDVGQKALTVTADADPSTTVADHFSKLYLAPNPVFTAGYSGFVLGEGPAVLNGTLAFDTTATISSPVGPYPVTPKGLTSSNYAITFVAGTLDVIYRWDGFLQPINDTAHQTGVSESKFKLGQTIPAKFEIKDSAGNIIQQAGNPTFTRSDNRGSCDATATVDTTPTISPDAGADYKLTGGQYLYGWSTKGLQAGEYRIFANLADGTHRYVDICLTK